MINAKLFHKMGGFDGQFFAHMEEIDLCWRLKNAGYTIWYTHHSTVYHVGGGTLPQSSPYKTFLNYRNNLLMMYKNLMPNKRCNRILHIRMLLDGISTVHSLLHGDTSVLKAVWKAHNSYRKLRRVYRLNRIPDPSPQKHCHDLSPGPSPQERGALHPSCVYQHSVVYQYFIKGRKMFGNLPNCPS